jgi:hypothetical protein
VGEHTAQGVQGIETALEGPILERGTSVLQHHNTAEHEDTSLRPKPTADHLHADVMLKGAPAVHLLWGCRHRHSTTRLKKQTM